MMFTKQTFRSLLLASSMIAPVIVTGACAVHARVYDPYRSDYHHWDGHERVYYNQWVTETHRDNKDFKARKPEEQNEYWKWRHDHDGH